MSEFADIEVGVKAIITGLEQGEVPLFATVTGAAGIDREEILKSVAGLACPAAVVVVEGRDYPMAGSALSEVRVTVYVVARSLRGREYARVGGVDCVGAYTLADQVSMVLENAQVAVGRHLSATGEKTVEIDEQTVAVELNWIAEQG